ncbi:hypothetical protein DUZ99_11800 [Xylanibacillus composti]|uniref:Uncharacterized protein n=1 Tax=Xylanibacillus composti TaxID=1572762 RepID=A0A8J4H1L5_9BACL|nr:hypothetical protein [Xylanibacillus composti]MDT9725657.1 hypothetical protein [Xylanibacillus composti]GIQ67752.1 hypothetical protein XYCOK13_05760 [Xylanibacillus composti]
MGLTDITGVSAPFFITSALFIMLILSAFSFSIVRLFQGRRTPGIVSIAVAIVSSVGFGVILNNWSA